jgi:pimeloyl-ACP methyl ester carboxylesterase
MGMERGELGRIPFLTMGSGPPMVFVGGLSFSGGVDAAGTEKMAASMVKPFAKRRRVLFVNRRRSLPRGMTMAEMAAEHADAIRSLGAGPVDVAGISTGGSIVQQMAADHPDVVDRLLLLCTACRLGPEGKRLQRGVAARVRAGALRQALALTVTGIVPPGRGQTAAAAAAWAAGPRVLAGGDDLSDMATTIEAEDTFDLAACASPIRAPTTILAGGADRWYSRELFDETARLIPGSRLRVFEGRGHVSVGRDPGFKQELDRFVQDGEA